MPRFKVAHLHEQGQDMIVVPLDSSFGRKVSQDQHDIITDLQVTLGLPAWLARSSRSGTTAVAGWRSSRRDLGIHSFRALIFA
jgi:hypothetical protein